MTDLDGNHLDETVFGPPSHDEVPHGHSHAPGQDPQPGVTHFHQHYHHGSSGVHNHRHGHPALRKVPEGDT